MTIQESIEKYGARFTAAKLVDQKISRLTYGTLSVDDLPDSYDICCIIDELQNALEEGSSKGYVKDILSQVDLKLIEELVYS
jgi:predicted RNA-binding protein with EMAP domain